MNILTPCANCPNNCYCQLHGTDCGEEEFTAKLLALSAVNEAKLDILDNSTEVEEFIEAVEERFFKKGFFAM